MNTLSEKFKTESIDINRSKQPGYPLNVSTYTTGGERFGFVSNLQSTIGYRLDFVESYRQYFLSMENDFNSLIDALGDPDADLEGYYFNVLGRNFSATSLRSALENPSHNYIVDGDGEDYLVDDVCTAIGDVVATSRANVAFLDTLVQTQNEESVSSKISLLRNKLEMYNGTITTQASSYYDYLINIIANSSSNDSALGAWASDINATPEENTNGDIVGFKSNVSDITGINPTLSLLSGIKISADTILGGIGSVVTTVISGLASIVVSIVKTVGKAIYWAVKKVGTWISEKFLNPNDLASTNIEGDPTFDGCVCIKRIYRSDLATSEEKVNWSLLYAKLNDHPAEYFRVFTLGATFYVQAEAGDSPCICVYTKKHLYDFNTAYNMYTKISLATTLTLGNTNADNLCSSYLNGMISQMEMTNAGESGTERSAFKGLIYSSKLVEFGIYLIDPLGEFDWTSYYTTIPGNNNYNHHTFVPYHISADSYPTRPTNLDWREYACDDLTVGDGEPLSNTCYPGLLKVFYNILIANDSKETGIYVPYSWATGPSPDSFRIKTDSENAEAASQAFKSIAIAAAILVIGIVAIKVAKNIKTTSLKYQRLASNAAFDPNISDEEYKKIVRKSRLWSKLSGKSYMDVASTTPLIDSSDRILSLLK